jgi:hypothetical protein
LTGRAISVNIASEGLSNTDRVGTDIASRTLRIVITWVRFLTYRESGVADEPSVAVRVDLTS